MLTPLTLFTLLLPGQLVAAPDGFSTAPSHLTDVRRRVLDARLASAANQPIVLTDSGSAARELRLRVAGASSVDGTLLGGRVVYGGALGGEDVSITASTSATLELTTTAAALAVSLSTSGDVSLADARALEVTFGGEPVFRLSSNAPLTWSNGVLTAQGSTGPTWLRVGLALTQVLLQAPLEDSDGSWGASMAWDPTRQRLIRIGGTLGLVDNPSTWAWDAASGWQDLQLSGPPTRVRSAMVWDAARQVMVVFGGSGATGLLDDTWELGASGWVERTPVHRPPARWAHGLAYDELRQRTVLFGGETAYELGDTWEWDGNDWIAMPPGGPVPRDAFGMAWDPDLGESVLFGGWDGHQVLGDTWSWNGTRWLALQTGVPPPRTSTAMAWDPVGHRLVMTGGWEPISNTVFEDTWTFANGSWQPGPRAPKNWYRMALASHPSLGVVGFGGRDASRSFGWTLAFATAGWRALDRATPRGPLLFDENGWTVHVDGWSWAVDTNTWRRAELLPFGAEQLAAFAGATALSIVPADGGSDVWLKRDRSWSLAASSLAAPAALVGDHASRALWLAEADGALLHWPEDGGATPAGSLPSGRLVAAAGGRLYLVSDQLSVFTPGADASVIGPLPFADTGAFRLLVDPRRGVLVASSATAGFAEWNGQAWEAVPVEAPVEWLAPRDGAIFGWQGDGGFARYDPLRELGGACSTSVQCHSGFCADGVCCDTACDGPTDCLACSLAAGGRVDGTCTPMRTGVVVTCGNTTGCLESVCVPGVPQCPAPVDTCPPDAGTAPGTDAGRPDAGRPAARDAGVEPTTPPGSCGCAVTSASDVLTCCLAAGLVAAFARSRRRGSRGERLP